MAVTVWNWKSTCRSGSALAMHHRLSDTSIACLNTAWKVDDNQTYALHYSAAVWHSSVHLTWLFHFQVLVSDIIFT